MQVTQAMQVNTINAINASRTMHVTRAPNKLVAVPKFH